MPPPEDRLELQQQALRAITVAGDPTTLTKEELAVQQQLRSLLNRFEYFIHLLERPFAPAFFANHTETKEKQKNTRILLKALRMKIIEAAHNKDILVPTNILAILADAEARMGVVWGDDDTELLHIQSRQGLVFGLNTDTIEPDLILETRVEKT